MMIIMTKMTKMTKMTMMTMMNMMNCKDFQINLTEHYLMIDDNEGRENYKTLKIFRLLKTLRLFIAFIK